MSNQTCATCKFYVQKNYWMKTGPDIECDGPINEHIVVDVSDDTGLSVIFKPPSTFGCNGWKAKVES